MRRVLLIQNLPIESYSQIAVEKSYVLPTSQTYLRNDNDYVQKAFL